MAVVPITLFGPALQAQPIPEAERSAMRYTRDRHFGPDRSAQRYS